MKKSAFLIPFFVLLILPPAWADESKATPQDVYNLVLKAYEVVNALGEDSFSALNDPKGEFVYKDTYVYVVHCPNEMMAHPFAMDKLKGVDLNQFPHNSALCAAAKNPDGAWVEYTWPKPGETKPSRKLTFVLGVEGTPYSVMAGIYSEKDKAEDLNKSLR